VGANTMIMAFRPGARRRRPHPFDAVITKTPVMLGRGRDPITGKAVPRLVTTETEDLSRVAPTDYAYSAQSPETWRVQPYGPMPGGMGLTLQQEFLDGRYGYTINADLSTKYWLKGPVVTQITPGTTDATNGVSHFFEIGGVLYALVGRYALVRAGDDAGDWTVSKDFTTDYGNSAIGVDVDEFYSNALSENTVWVSINPDASENFAHFNGTTWTQASGSNMGSLAFAHTDREFWRARDINLLIKCDTDADPKTASNWPGASEVRVGEKNSAIVRMAVSADGTLVVIKTDGVYSLNADGTANQHFPFLGAAPDASNGKGVGQFINDLFIPFRQGLNKLTPEFRFEPMFEKQLETNDTPVRGQYTAFAGHDTFHAYVAIYNGTDSYLGKMMPDGTLHGSITIKFASKKITALAKSTIGADSGRTRLYIGFSDGTVGWLQLPNDPNPAADTSYDFSTTDGEIYLPLFTGQADNDPKVLYATTFNGPNLNSTNYAQLQYKTDPDVSSYTAFGTDFNVTRKTADFANATAGVLVDFKVLLVSTATTATPQVSGMGIHHAWRPERREVYVLNVLIEDGLLNWDNVPLRYGRERLLTVTEGARDAQGSVTIIMPDHSSQQVTVVPPFDLVQAWDDRTGEWKAAAQMRCVQFTQNITSGTYARMELLNYGQLSAYVYGQIERL